MATELLLIDLSSLLYPIFHVCGSEPDPDAVSTRTVARVRALASSHPHAAVCCDSGKSFRAEIDPSYKATRESKPEALFHQMRRTIEILRADGFPIWKVKGFEADDVIATGVALSHVNVESVESTVEVLIASSDKDLLALVGPRVRVKSLTSGDTLGEAEVLAKFGVRPQQMTDYLCLVGDASDNIKGAKGIGPKKAAELLGLYISLDFLYAAIDDKTAIMTPAVAASLAEFRERLPVVRQLVAMRTDAPIDIAEAFKERVPSDVTDFNNGDQMSSELFPPETHELTKPIGTHAVSERMAEQGGAGPAEPGIAAQGGNSEAGAITPAGHDTEAPQVVQRWTPGPQPAYERQLDPRDMSEAWKLAQSAMASRLFSAYGNASASLAAIMTGRELGLPAMASLRSVHVIEGRMALSASLMVALVLKSGLAEYFRPVSFDAKQATFETLRKGNGNKPVVLQHTIEMAITAGLVKDKSNWLKVPIDMLCARAQSRLARMCYPDLFAGLYDPEELREAAE